MKFLRQQGHFKKRIIIKWRKPKGHHSKLREKRRGMHQMPGIGFKKSERRFINLIKSLSDLESLYYATKLSKEMLNNNIEKVIE